MHALLLCPPALRAALAPRLATHGLPARDLPLHPAALLPALFHDEPALALFGGGAACLPLLRRTRIAPTPLPGRTLDEKVRAAEAAYATQVLSRTKSGTRAAQKLGTHLDRLRRLTKGSD